METDGNLVPVSSDSVFSIALKKNQQILCLNVFG
jgi:hypothetical protein